MPIVQTISTISDQIPILVFEVKIEVKIASVITVNTLSNVPKGIKAKVSVNETEEFSANNINTGTTETMHTETKDNTAKIIAVKDKLRIPFFI